MYIDPSAFGTSGIRQNVRKANGIRYELWSTRFDLTLRSFQVMLFQTEESVYVQAPDVQSVVGDMLRNAVDDAIAWGEVMEISTGLGLASAQHFQLSSSVGCVGFTIELPRIESINQPFGWYNGVQGFYCDPFSTVLPRSDIETTLQSIGVEEVFIPSP